ncbi:MAG: cation:proton antiporter subunit C [Verrucomicrobiales bacterium]|nr:cation:proton antiporter subunit C [Verrucomicrobiales bacterium]
MSEFVETVLRPHFNFWVYVILMMIGLWALIAKNNLIKKLIGLSIFQTAIILFYVSMGVKENANIPILDHHGHEEHVVAHAEDGHAGAHDKKAHVEKSDHATGSHGESHPDATSPDPDTMANPLPHVLMLTAIVVGVATLGVALSIVQMIFREYGSLEEDEILEQVKAGNSDG